MSVSSYISRFICTLLVEELPINYCGHARGPEVPGGLVVVKLYFGEHDCLLRVAVFSLFMGRSMWPLLR